MRLELPTARAVIDPLARGGGPFACGDRSGVTNDGDRLTGSACLHANNAEAVLGVVEGDAAGWDQFKLASQFSGDGNESK